MRKDYDMLYRILLAVTVILAASAFVFQSATAAVAGLVMALLTFTSKGLDL